MLSVGLCNMFIHCGVPSISKPCIEIYLQKIASLINLQLPKVILKKIGYFVNASSYYVHVYQFSGKSGFSD